MDRQYLAAAGLTRPVSAAARVAAMKARMNPVSMVNKGGVYSMATLDNLNASISKWLRELDELPDPSLSRKKMIEQEEDSGEERVHKAPTPAKEQDKISAKDVKMVDAPPLQPVVTNIRLDSEKTGAEDEDNDADSTKRLRPITPPNLPLGNIATHSENQDRAKALSVTPASPPARKFEDLEIRSPKMPANMTLTRIDINTSNLSDSSPTPPTSNTRSRTYASVPLRPTIPHSTNISTTAIPPTLNPPFSSQNVSQSDLAEPIEPLSIPPTPPSETPASPQNKPTSSATRSLSNASTNKKPKLSALSSQKTILDMLMEKKSRNAIYYDGPTQKRFHGFVLEMSQQIQSIKRERRLIMFAKDPACVNLLDRLDTSLQETLKSVETSSFLWLKGRPDMKEMKGLSGRLNDCEEWIREFRKLGWTMTGDDSESEEENSSNDEENEL